MKALIFTLLSIVGALSATAQTMYIYNHAPCDLAVIAHRDYPVGIIGGLGPVYSATNVVNCASGFGPGSLTLSAPSISWTDSRTGSSAVYDPATIWSELVIMQFCSNAVHPVIISGTDNGVSSNATSAYPSTLSFGNAACCNDHSYTATWTDLGGGDVQVDIY